MNLITISGIRGFIDENGTAHLNLEDVSKGLGFVETKGDYVRWQRVEGYLQELRFSTSGERPEFIPENIFYRLAMKAKNEVAEKFQGTIANEVLPSIRKHGTYSRGIDISKLPPELQMFNQIFTSVAQQALRIEQVNEQVQTIKETFVASHDDWRETTAEAVNRIVQATGKTYQDAHAELYAELESRAGVKLKLRRDNIRKRMAMEGATKTAINAVNKLDAIEANERIKQIFITIVKEYSIKYLA